MRFVYILIDLNNKPTWFKSVNPAETVPALDVGDRVIGDSYDIVRFLEETFPSPPLDLPGNKEAEEVTGNVYKVFSAWAKNSNASKNAELEAKFTAELKKIDDFLSKSKHAFLCRDSWSIADCVLMPRLYHLTTVARHYKKYTEFEKMSSLWGYMVRAYATREWKETDYPPEYILADWAKYFK